MSKLTSPILDRLTRVPPFNHLPLGNHPELADVIEQHPGETGDTLFYQGAPLNRPQMTEKGLMPWV